MKLAKKSFIRIICVLLAVLFLFVSCADDGSSSGDNKDDKKEVNSVDDNSDKAVDAGAEKSGKPVAADETAVEKTGISATFEVLSSGLFQGIKRYQALDYNSMKTVSSLKLSVDNGLEALSEDVSELEPVYQVVNRTGIEEAEVVLRLESNADLMYLYAEGLINDIGIIDGNVIYDSEDGGVYFDFPALYDEVLYLNLNEYSEASDFDVSAFEEAVDLRKVNNTNIASAEIALLLCDEAAFELLAEYSESALDDLGESENTEKVLSVDEVSAEVECHTYTVDNETLKKLYVNLLEKLRDDEKFKDKFIQIVEIYLENMNEYNTELGLPEDAEADDVYQDYFIPYVDEAIASIEDTQFLDDGLVLDVSLYYSNDVFTGITVENSGSSINLYYIEDVNNSALTLNMETPSNCSGLKMSGTVSAGLYDGVVTLYDSEYDIEAKITMEDLNIDTIDDGTFSGTFTVNGDVISLLAEREIPDGLVFKAVVDSEYVTYSIFELSAYYNDELAATLNFNTETDDSSFQIELPDDYLDITETAEEYLSTLSETLIEVLIENLDEIGVSKQTILELLLSDVI